MMPSDSPFPPLKTEHRYKGVYERAGFDVNLDGAPFDSKSPYLKKSFTPSPTTTFGLRMASDSQQNTFTQRPDRTGSSHSLPLLAPPLAARFDQNQRPRAKGKWDSHAKEDLSQDSSTTLQNAHYPYGYTSAPNSATREVSTPPSSALTHASLNSAADSIRIPKRSEQRQFAQPLQHQSFEKFQPIQPVKPQGYVIGGDYHYRPEGERNVKNLSLRIHDSNFSSPSMAQVSTDSLCGADSATFDDTAAFKRHTPETSASSSDEFIRKNSIASETSVRTAELTSVAPYPFHDGLSSADKDLSKVLGDFRREVEEHRKYDPRNRSARAVKQHNEIPDHDSQKIQHAPAYRNDSLQDDGASESNGTTDTPNSDFQDFLQASARQNNFRNSHLSTISSIISKPVHPDDEDAEVETELQRQLESLKTGSDTSGSSMKFSDDSFVTALNYLNDYQLTVPSFKIDIASQISDPASSDSDTETEAESKVLSRFQEDTTFDQDDIDFAPLNFKKQSPAFTESPQTPVMRSRVEDPLDTPETIMPLSPKNHRVEEELKDINFRGVNTPINSDVIQSLETEYKGTVTAAEDDEILLHNPTPSEFNAFPKSVVGMDVPSFRISTTGSTHPAGEGPCRVCNEEIDPHARGLQKSIYSRRGDMSGQWHRRCFSCAYVGCDVKFSKHVTCYVLLDNVFCHNHYHFLNGTRCQSCNLGIEGECIENELKQKWHVSCLKCTKCHSPIQSDYFLINNKIFCNHDAVGEIQTMETNGLSTNDKIEKRRTRMLFIDQQHGM